MIGQYEEATRYNYIAHEVDLLLSFYEVTVEDGRGRHLAKDIPISRVRHPAINAIPLPISKAVAGQYRCPGTPYASMYFLVKSTCGEFYRHLRR